MNRLLIFAVLALAVPLASCRSHRLPAFKEPSTKPRVLRAVEPSYEPPLRSLELCPGGT